MSERRAARRGVASATLTIPPELLDGNDPVWVDDRADRGRDRFGVFYARRHRHHEALYAFARENGLMSERCPAFIDWTLMRELAEASGQHWPPRRLREGRR